MHLLSLIFALFPLQLAAGEVDLMTRLGPARIVGNGDSPSLLLGQVNVALPQHAYIVRIQDRRGDLMLLALASGGTACPLEYVWVHATPGDVRQSEVFGTCAELTAISQDGETVRVTIPAGRAGAPPVVFVYDGASMVREEGERPAIGIRPDDGPEFWIGRYPFELAGAAETHSRLTELMDEDAYADAMTGLGLSSPMQVEGEWIVGSGCEKYNCPANATLIAVSRRDGRLLVAVAHDGKPTRLFGDPGGALPPSVADFLAR